MISLASQDVHDASFVHGDSFAGTMPDSDVGGPPSRLRRFGGQTTHAGFAETKLARPARRAKSGAEGGTRTPTVLLPPAPQAGEFSALQWIGADPANGS